jgi:hypothetical protein
MAIQRTQIRNVKIPYFGSKFASGTDGIKKRLNSSNMKMC